MSGASKLVGVLDWVGRKVDDLIAMGYPESVAKRISSGELPMDYESRMARAREQGYDMTPMYHGTSADIKAFDPELLNTRDDGFIGRGVYTSQSPFIGSSYANTATSFADETGNFVDPNVLQLVTKGSPDDYYQFSLKDKSGLAGKVINDPNYADHITSELIKIGKRGADVRDVNGDIVERVNFYPRDLKSLLSAAFDPEYFGRNILGSRMAPTAGAGILGYILSQEDDDAYR